MAEQQQRLSLLQAEQVLTRIPGHLQAERVQLQLQSVPVLIPVQSLMRTVVSSQKHLPSPHLLFSPQHNRT
jgi:hypothetical protein